MHTNSQQPERTYSPPLVPPCRPRWSQPSLSSSHSLRRCGSLLLALALIVGASVSTAEPKPNLVVILADDLGWMDVAAYAARARGVERSDCYYETPHIDALADQGMLFTQAYAAALCSPARAALLTGQHPARHGFLTASGHTTGSYHSRKMTPPKGYHIHDRRANTAQKTDPALGFIGPSFSYVLQSGQEADERDALTIAEALKGYRSAMVGKWHLGGLGTKGYQPGDQGFDEIAYFDHGGSPYFDWQAKWKGVGVTGDDLGIDYLTDDLTERAVRFIADSAKKKQPFFLYFPQFAVHSPRQAKLEDLAYFEAKANRGWNGHSMPEYAGVLRGLDNSVGRVVKTLHELGIAENTLLLFMSDNGGIDRTNATSNAPLRAGKGKVYEGGVRVPFIAYQPGTIKAGSVCKVAIGIEDIFPTLLSFAGQGDELSKMPLDGESILPLFTDPTNSKKQYSRDTFFWHTAGGGYDAKKKTYTPTQTAIRKGDYKLIFDDQGYLQLYNIATDLSETQDLADTMPEKAQALFKQLDSWLNDTVPLKYQRRPNPLYDPAANAQSPLPPYRKLRR
jgi:arylsulfatase A-like enzyme